MEAGGEKREASEERARSAGAGDEDRALMGRVQSGDEVALAALMERWELPVKAVIGRLVLNAREAEELAQETFVRVWQQREKFRADAAFRPWVFSIAVNLARNRLRWWRRRPEVSLQEWTETSELGDGRREWFFGNLLGHEQTWRRLLCHLYTTKIGGFGIAKFI